MDRRDLIKRSLATPIFAVLRDAPVSIRRPLQALTMVILASCASQSAETNGDVAAAAAKTGAVLPWTSTEVIAADCKKMLETATKLRDGIKGAEAKTAETVLGPYNELGRVLSNSIGLASLMGAVHPDEAIRKAAEACERDGKAFTTDLTLDRGLYDALAGVPTDGLDAGASRFVEKSLLEFRLAGVDKDEETRKKLKALNNELVELGQTFGRTIREDVKKVSFTAEQLKGLPQDFIDGHKPNADGKIELTTNYPDFFPTVTYAQDEQVRKAIYIAFLTRGHPANDKTLKTMLEKRHELAKMLGFESWADYKAKDKMSGSAETIRSFTEDVAKIARPRMEADLKVLLESKKKDIPSAKAIQTWDRFYYVQKVQNDKYGFDASAVRAYFQYDKVKTGIFDLYGELFGLEFVKVDRPVWHASVDAYDMKRDGKVLGQFYLDMHPREGKYQHAAMFPIDVGLAGGQLPSASLVCNFPDPSGGTGLMEHTQVKTFFHEFGHLIHHLLARDSKWFNQGGINTEWDFVEAPSQILEEWAWSPEVLQRFAKHHETGEAIPTETVNKMRAAADFGLGVHIMRQVFYQAMSFYLHANDPANLDLIAFTKDTQKKYSPYPYVDGTHVYASFGHLNGYSSVYYTYQWSLALAKDMFTRFEKEGLMNTTVARDYADKVLAPGGAKPAAELVKDFLGRDYNLDAYKRWLQAKQQ